MGKEESNLMSLESFVTRKCCKCQSVLPIDSFHRDRRKALGRSYSCKECRNKQVRDSYQRRSIELKKRAREFRKVNPWYCWAYDSIRGHKQKRLGLTVQIDVKWLTELARRTTNCRICGQELLYLNQGRHGRGSSPSLDRINNESVLRPDNVQIICFSCNMTKWQRTMEEFIRYCGSVWWKFGKTLVSKTDQPTRQPRKERRRLVLVCSCHLSGGKPA